ncbi:MAG TPA: polysaccharide deacetylase family protein [Acidimicrobiales bacterium]|nr:polysaccharide deacetylase family protein [Acidimicrobiales bacterium]
MSRPRHLRPRTGWLRTAGIRQLVTGLVALPLSALPFAAYLNLTPEGRLVRDRALVALAPPSLPDLTAAQQAAAVRAAPRYEGAVMALAYHGIGSASDGEGGFVIPPGRFAEHLATLKAAGMRTVTAAEVAAAFDGGAPLPEKAVMLSFDDGRTDAMMFADPLLKEAEMSATMFVITGAASEPGIYYASWDRLESYARSGRWDLQAHTAELHREHEAAGGGKLPALTSLYEGETLEEYRARVRADLASSSTAIEDHTDRRAVAFAYPFGAYGAERTNSPEVRRVLRDEVDRRFAIAFHQDEQESIPLATPQDDRLGLRRLEVQDWSGVELLRRIAAAARRTGPSPVEPPPRPAPVVVPVPETVAPAITDPDLTIPPVATVPPRPTPSTTAGPRRPPAAAVAPPPPTTAPPPPAPPAPPAPPPPTTPTPVPPTAAPTTAVPPATTTTTRPPATTTTTTTTTRPDPTTTTTAPNGCRSRGQGSICKS